MYLIDKQTDIIPAVIPNDFQEIVKKISVIRLFVKTFQIDITDGQFVPSKSWPFLGSGFEKLPFANEIYFEADLMVQNPEEIIEDLIKIGFKRLVFHIETFEDFNRIENICAGRVEVGLAVLPSTEISDFESLVEKVDVIQFMGINRIGFQGEVFNTDVLEKIKFFKEKYPEKIVSVDGGVSLENYKSIIEAGADRLVSGSAIFNSDDIIETINKFKNGD